MPNPTIQEMVALRERIERTDARIAKSGYGAMSEQEHADSVTAKLQFPAAVTVAETLAKALRVVAYRECEDIQESVTSDEGGVIITKQPCGECPPCEAAATLDDLYPNWRDVL